MLALLPLACARVVRVWPDGTKRAEGRLAWCQEKEDGFWTYWHQNGVPREQGRYDRGLRTGTWVQWFPNGQQRSRGERRWNDEARASQREGPWIFWHENGVVRALGVYREGKREGHWDYSLDSGGLDGLRTGEYHEDRKVD